jgi:ABC-type proline/glycine betaine transport system permease subunit
LAVQSQESCRSAQNFGPNRNFISGKGGWRMHEILNQILRFAQQGIGTIFRFIELVWNWSITQITNVFHAPWQSWPLWKEVLLVLVVAGVAYVLYKAVSELWESGERALVAFAGLLGAFIKTLPMVLIAGLIALGGIWVLNNVDLSQLPLSSGLRFGSG